MFFVFKQKTAYEMRISDWSSDVCSSDLNDRTTHELVGFFGIDTQLHGHVDGFIELGGGRFLDQGQGFGDRVELVAIDLGGNSGRAFSQFGHAYTPSTVMPMLRDRKSTRLNSSH